MNTKLKLLLGIICAISILVIPGCAGTATPTVAEATFIIGDAVEPGGLDPHRAGASGGQPVLYYSNSFLLSTSTQDSSLTPYMADSWQALDPLTWKFNLRKDVVFSNGQPLTSADVQYTFYRAMGRTDPNYIASAASILNSIVESVETPDDYTVLVHCKRADVSFPASVYGWAMMPKAYIEQVGNDGFNKDPIGAGPFKFEERKVGEYIKVEANDKYWLKNPKLGQIGLPSIKNLVYRYIPELETRIAALKTGEVDGVTGVTADRAKELEKEPNLKIYYSSITQPNYMVMNWRDEKDPETGEKNPFTDVRVRQAMNYALDIDSLISNFGTGREYRTTMIGKGAVGYNPNVPFYKYDPAKARQLMKEAGYEKGFSTKWYVVTTTPIYEAMQKYWKDIGVDAKFTISTGPVAQRMMVQKKLYGIVAWTSGIGPDPANLFFDNNVSYDGFSALHAKDEKTEDLANLAKAEFDPGKRNKLINDVIQVIWKDAWFVPLYEPVAIKAINTKWNYESDPGISGLNPIAIKGLK